ncbi:hypothetical protein L1987_67045 [Smallanthus sonchifolius]|uniref:Uncharacterized protein n=1 Tax=Smallanthus sonchifolius TaxID=185202 RepID=A0ACB9BZ59_9ASTR|nr:hypothetical protein L1987_67045 [Smallanthus sonchifolius]
MVVSSYIRDLKIQAPQELVDEDHPLQYKSFDHYKHGSRLGLRLGNHLFGICKLGLRVGVWPYPCILQIQPHFTIVSTHKNTPPKRPRHTHILTVCFAPARLKQPIAKFLFLFWYFCFC